MRARRALLALMLALPDPAAAHSISLVIAPSPDPDLLAQCSVVLLLGQIGVAQSLGTGAPPARPLLWRANEAEIAAITAALQAFVAGELPSVPPRDALLPPPPYATATWQTQVDGGLVAGRYMQRGSDLPDVLDRLIATVLPGSYCATPPAR